MALDIDVTRVAGVLLADRWHAVKPGTFRVDTYNYVAPRPQGRPSIPHGYTGPDSLATDVGYTFTTTSTVKLGLPFGEEGAVLFGPLTAILAVVYQAEEET